MSTIQKWKPNYKSSSQKANLQLNISRLMNSITFITNCINSQGGPMAAIQLDLSNCNLLEFTPQIKQLIESCPNLYELILKNCLLKSLELLPALNLQIIDLSQNKLNDTQINMLIQYQGLKQLSLKNNLIQSFEALRPLIELKNLTQLDLSGNPLCQSFQDYQKILFQNFPNLELIDNRLRNGDLISEDDQQQEENNVFLFDKRYDSQELDNDEAEDIDFQLDPFEEDEFEDGDDEFQYDQGDFAQGYMGNKKRKY